MSIDRILEILVPGAETSAEKILRWRFFMGIWAIISIGAIICLYTITAKSDDIKDLKIAVYPSAISELHEKKCLTVDPVVKHNLTLKIQEYQLQYKESTGVKWPLDSCKDIREAKANER